jgi:hypothetical protein
MNIAITQYTQMLLYNYKYYIVLEPDALRGARPDLRGGSDSNVKTLPDWFYQWFYIFVEFI